MRCLAADSAWTRNIRNIAWQMPYATSTPNANEANTAHTNIKELIANLPRIPVQQEPSLVPSSVILDDLAPVVMKNPLLPVA